MKNKTEVSPSESEIGFCGRSREEKPRVIKNAVATESELTFEKIKDFVDILDKSDNVVALSDGDKIKFRDLFNRYRDVFAFSDNQLGRTSLVQHTIDTGDALPIKQRPYRTTPENKREIDC